MKKFTSSTIICSLLATSLFAQVTIKKDIFQYFGQLPNTPTSLQDAYQNCKCVTHVGTSTEPVLGPTDSLVAPVQNAMIGDMQSAGSLTNTQIQQSQAGMAIGNQMQADNVNAMTQDQKLNWVQNNMQSYGNLSGQATFAQKMNDPAEKAKFMAMTPNQKMAYMQQMGMMNNSPSALTPANTNYGNYGKATDAVSKQKIMIAQTGTPDAQKLYQTLDSELQNANTPHQQIQQKEFSAVSAGINNSAYSAKAVQAKYMKQQLDLAAQQLVEMNKSYSAIFAFLQNSDSAYCNAMVAANYGYTGDAGQDNTVTILRNGQTFVLTHIGKLAGYLKDIYSFAAGWQLKKLQSDAGK